MPTEDRVVQAGICVYDYVLYPAMRGEFNRVLASVKASPAHAVSISVSFDTGTPCRSTNARNSPTARGPSATGSPLRKRVVASLSRRNGPKV